jgi:hypothetical protein
MKVSAILLMLGMVASSATAEEKLSEGGRSPDGTHEVRIARQNMNDQPTGYGIHIHSINPEKRIFTLPEIGGYLEYDGAIERDHSHWHGSSGFVAITDQSTRHSRELYVVAISNGTPVVLKQPDFYQNALGRVDAVEIDFASVVTPKKWDGDDLILQVHFTANHRRAYTFEVVLHLSHGPQTAPWLSLKSVKKLKEEDG